VKIRFNNVDAFAEQFDRGEIEALKAVDEDLRPFIPGFNYFPHVRNSLKSMYEDKTTVDGMEVYPRRPLHNRIRAVMGEMKDGDALAWKTSPYSNDEVRQWFDRWRAPIVHWHTSAWFATGLLPLIVKNLQDKFVRPALVDERTMRTFRSHPTTSVQLRDYQFEGLKVAFTNQVYGNVWWPRGILYHATGAGKTETAAAMIQMAQVPTVFLVHRRDLLHQTAERFRKYGIDTGIVGDGEYDPRPNGVTVATVQTIKKRVGSDPNNLNLGPLALTEQIFFDEAHLLAAKFDKANMFVAVADSFKHAYMRWGLTATPGMRDQYSNWLLEGATGSVLHTVRSAELIEQNWLTPPKVYFVTAHGSGIPNRSSGATEFDKPTWIDKYDNEIVNNAARHDQVAHYAKTVGQPCLVLVSRVDHGKLLQRRIPGAVFLHGGIESADRRAVIQQARRGEVGVIIATTIFDEGVDIPELRSIILAGAGRSQIKMLQRIGRGLRRAEQKNSVTIVDFMDESSATLRQHSEERMRVCREEGFQVFTQTKTGEWY